jgi:predicted kinase
MNPKSPVTIYAMVGLMGSGKTTLALKIAKEKGALFQSLDGTIKSFNEPVVNLEGYERLMSRALGLMFDRALQALKSGQSVVFDVGRLTWIIELAAAGDAKIEVYHFEIPTEERWRRVQKRNEEKAENVYHWTMSKEEFDAQGPHGPLPNPVPGLKIIKITE